MYSVMALPKSGEGLKTSLFERSMGIGSVFNLLTAASRPRIWIYFIS